MESTGTNALVAELDPRQAELLEAFRSGARPALSRIISIVENERAGFRALLHELRGRLGHAHRIGLTGPPGAGKSTLLSALVAAYRERGEKVGVIAVDPTSPFTGGALLGDRIRMNDVALDQGVFIRSMATRGSVGGLALATKEVADVMDAFGFDRVLVETVGVGQSELEIAAAADTTVVVLVPESGDSIQTMKAGLMEAADVFVINKSDRSGADRLAREVNMMIHLRTGRTMRNVPAHHGVDMKRAAAAGAARAEDDGAASTDARPAAADAAPAPWSIPVLQTIAVEAEGIGEVVETLDQHRDWLTQSGEGVTRRRARLAERVREEVERQLRGVWNLVGKAIADDALDALERGEVSPYEVAAEVVRRAAPRA